MKPIKLKIHGLNSFLQEETIDFTALTATGLFGIFGPTGSGKSTIIDAISLALYGEIPRLGAKQGKYGMNVGSNAMGVDFTFAMGERTYQVVRGYKRGKSEITNPIGKIWEMMGDTQTIIEDKPSLVKKAVEAIVGLSFDDFSKSVVLPQGKFSEFLLLTGTDRADMLERIFNLSAYGETMYRKVKDNLVQVKSQMLAIQNTIADMGDISPQILAEKEAQLAAHTAQLEADIIRCAKIVAKQKDNDTHAAWFLEWQGHQSRLDTLLENETAMEEAKAHHAQGTKAAIVKPYVDSHNACVHNVTQATQALKESENNLLKQQDNCSLWQKQLDQVTTQYETSYPALVQQQQNANRAVLLQADVDVMEQERQTLLATYVKLKTEHQQTALHMAEQETTTKNMTAQFEEIAKDKLCTFQTPQQKATIQQARDTWLLQQEATKKHESLMAQYTPYKEEHKKDQAKQSKWQEERTAVTNQITQTKEKIDTLAENEPTNQDRLLEEKTKLIQEESDYKAKISAVSTLAESLEEGAPCPVCGATHHPIPAQTNDTSADEPFAQRHNQLATATAKRKQWDTAKQQAEATLASQTKALSDLDIAMAGVQERITANERQLAQWATDIDALAKQMSSAKVQLDAFAHTLHTTDFAAAYKNMVAMEAKRETLYQAEEALRQTSDALAKSQEAAKQALTNTEKEMASIAAVGIEKKATIDKQKLAVEALTNGEQPAVYGAKIAKQIQQLADALAQAKSGYGQASQAHIEAQQTHANHQTAHTLYAQQLKEETEKLQNMLATHGFKNGEEVDIYWRNPTALAALLQQVNDHQQQLLLAKDQLANLAFKLTHVDTQAIAQNTESLQKQFLEITKNNEQNSKTCVIMKIAIETMEKNLHKANALQLEQNEMAHKMGMLDDLADLLQGKKMVRFMAKSQLSYMTADASRRLFSMTGGGYALALDQSNFVITDNHNGGISRSPKSLSGGETFMVSLCLALALSAKIQLSSHAPLAFFFLDEGFGTLDPALLDVVVGALEQLQNEKLSMGIITHVEELKYRLPNRLLVTPASPGLHGTKVTID